MAIHSSKSIVKINLGCGPIGEDDWINIDYGILPFVFRHRLLKVLAVRTGLVPKHYRDWRWPAGLMLHDCRKPLPFSDNSVDYVYTSHFLEHLRKYETAALMRETYRILRPGGYVRVAVPDLELLARKYVQRDYNFFSTLDHSHLDLNEARLTNRSNPPLADLFLSHFYPPKNIHPAKSRLVRLADLFTRWHVWHYDFDSLHMILKEIGFADVQRREYRRGLVPDIEFLDSHPDASLFVEAVKPKSSNDRDEVD